MRELNEVVKAEVLKIFSATDAAHVISRLAETSFTWEESGVLHRIQIAILWLSKGKIKDFELQLEGAKCDWRDTLVAAGLGKENWKDILKNKGIDASDW